MAIAAFCLAPSTANAQNLNSGYFDDGYIFRHNLNPAFSNRQGYFSMPGLGNLNVKVNSSLRLDDVLYDMGGKTVLFVHPNVDAANFLSAVKDKNKISVNVREQILGFAFKGMGGYNTFEVNARANVNAIIPGSILRLAKEGGENKTYDIKDLAAHADAYGEIALGHSHRINNRLNIGVKAKLLLGVGNLDADFSKASLTLGEGEWSAVTNAKIQTSIKKMDYKIEETTRGPEGQKNVHRYVNGVDNTKWGVDGYGFAFDLGAEYKIGKEWVLSAALLDLGYIGWKNNYVASTAGDKSIHTNAYLFNVDEEANNSFENEADRLAEDLSALYELQDMGDTGKRSRGLTATFNAGVEYIPLFYKKMSLGLMNSTRFGKYGSTEFRLSANVAPTNIFSVSANVVAGTYGLGVGWLINFHPNGFSLFLGMDDTPVRLSKQGVPLSGKANVNIGLNFPFGNNKQKRQVQKE